MSCLNITCVWFVNSESCFNAACASAWPIMCPIPIPHVSLVCSFCVLSQCCLCLCFVHFVSCLNTACVTGLSIMCLLSILPVSGLSIMCLVPKMPVSLVCPLCVLSQFCLWLWFIHSVSGLINACVSGLFILCVFSQYCMCLWFVNSLCLV
jgi:hypothetical protein